ncbi:restriction endonuclease subunit S [Rubritepida flocculans]|uniref:restriction endonuclease subunit S n=1 Tax=Rubritepida flocculans TaxID=182403 RepID=UPI0006842B45|nr:restriction endonuclease subunit S [Rubritepida flocculans]
MRGKAILREVDERSISGAEELLTVSHKTGVTPRRLKNVTMFKAESYVGHKLARPKDIVINTMWAWMAATGVSGHLGIVSPSYGVYRPRGENLDPRYLDYLLRTPLLKAEYHRRSKGIRASRLRLYADQFLDIRFPVPPLDEQQRIANYLDAHGRLTNRLIRNRRRMLAVLKERRQGIINDAVTRGVDPAAAMKATPLDSVPLIPSHWQLKRLKYLTRFSNGIAFKPADWKDAGTPIIRIENLNGSDHFNYTDRADLPERLLIQPGDLLFAWSGNRGTSFGSFEWDRAFPAYLNQHIFKLESFSLHRRFFFYALRAVTKRVEDNAHGIIGLVHVTKPELGAIEVPVPPPAEQEAIADHLDRVLGEINAAAEKLVREIKLVEEYRERLIADAVTGKLDVRAAALAMLADEIDGEDLPLEDEEATTAEDADDEDDADVALAEVDE